MSGLLVAFPRHVLLQSEMRWIYGPTMGGLNCQLHVGSTSFEVVGIDSDKLFIYSPGKLTHPQKTITYPLKTNISPEKWWLEDYFHLFSFWKDPLSGDMLSFSGRTSRMHHSGSVCDIMSKSHLMSFSDVPGSNESGKINALLTNCNLKTKS